MRALNRLSPVAVAVAGALLLAGGTAGAARAEPAAPIVIKPPQVARGADIAIAHVEGSTIVDGSTRITVPGSDRVELMGRAGTSYVVRTFSDQGVQHVLRATSAGQVTPLVTPSRKGEVVELSTDGTRVAQATFNGGFTSTKVKVWSTVDGSVVIGRSFPSLVSVLDLDASRVVLGGFDADTVSWKTGPDKVKTLSARTGVVADITADRLSTLTGDPYDGGCTVVSRLSKPTKALWKSCDERVQEFSPDGRRIATVGLLTDGIGPNQVSVRTVRGALVATYRIKDYFGLVTWESDTALLLESFGRSQYATIRCTAATCDRASELAPTPDFRTVPLRPSALPRARP